MFEFMIINCQTDLDQLLRWNNYCCVLIFSTTQKIVQNNSRINNPNKENDIIKIIL